MLELTQGFPRFAFLSQKEFNRWESVDSPFPAALGNVCR